ncbi:M23 family metallopeptidase [Chryseobacterium sp. 09-1422]|uniref:M23 family metallopeptidase n=1 Tax=Chryseobacterium kimseyorum TaxID=2984028 RepID=A0ABT3HV09_9FLAO|nr:M23 family metallopeptidase [Chryseobacterium kimseyorum]MCW3167626.1 M23 family metallopeptidase [Chryseobacterium kimseyorum]
MKKLITLIFISHFMIIFAQKNIKMYNERKGDTITFYVDNQEIYPVSLVFNGQPEINNLKKPELFKTIQVIPAKTVKQKVTYFVVTDKNKGWGIKKMPGYQSYMGDITIKNYDTQYVYDLPFGKGKALWIHQGYNGTFSHQNENSLDFIMPEGTEVLAAREGKVIDIVQSNNRSCPTRSCAPFGNYVSILHPDGTIAQYYHLEQNGVQVKLGESVTKGQFIAYSGNTGWSSGPHLHFNVYISSATADKNRITVKTLFKTGHGDKVQYLEEGKSYARGY